MKSPQSDPISPPPDPLPGPSPDPSIHDVNPPLLGEASPPPPQSSCHHDDHFYFESIEFLVEDCVFRVPQYRFEQASPTFLQSLAELSSASKHAESDGSYKSPIYLKDICLKDFRAFLEYLYPRALPLTVNLDISGWRSVLYLSSIWDMDVIREDAIRSLEPLVTDPAEKLGIAIDLDIKSWLLPALTALVRRDQPLSTGDLSHIGIENALKIAASNRGVNCTERIKLDFATLLDTIPRHDQAIMHPEYQVPIIPELGGTGVSSGGKKKKKKK
ncbi:hypothetical protein ONZ45_g13036 [Pleurotus djamor]|nr:hypothetical protein ONZ45_g13036 [Pleurotus djamor]